MTVGLVDGQELIRVTAQREKALSRPASPRALEPIAPWLLMSFSELCRGGRRGRQAMHSLPRVQTAALQGVPEVAARRWQAEKAAQVAFFATALFAAPLYLSP